MRQLKGIVLGFVALFSALALLTGCNTVKGTVHGAGQDVQATANALTPEPTPVHHTYRHKAHKHHVKHKKAKAEATGAAAAPADANKEPAANQAAPAQTPNNQ